jgi:hypothetical protein
MNSSPGKEAEMQAAEVVQFPLSSRSLGARLACRKCGTTTDPACDCGASYSFVRPGKRAAMAIAANPEKSDRAIAEQLGISDMTVARARKSTATKVAVGKRIGKDGKARAMPVRGSQIAVPDGYTTLGEAVAVGIEHERSGVAPKEAGKRVGFAHQAYAAMRDIVLLSERTDLPPNDAKTVQSALSDLNTNRQSGRPAQAVKAIALKVWGRKGNRFKSEAKRLEAFLSTISTVVSVCTSASEMTIPHIGEEYQKKASKDLSDSAPQKGRRMSVSKGRKNPRELRFVGHGNVFTAGSRAHAWRLTCSRCGATKDVSSSGGKSMPPQIIIKKFLQAGWLVGNKPTGDVCSDCKRKPIGSRLDLAKTAISQAAAPCVANGDGKAIHFSELTVLACKLPPEQIRQLIKTLHDVLPQRIYKRKIVEAPIESDAQYAEWLEQEDARLQAKMPEQ